MFYVFCAAYFIIPKKGGIYLRIAICDDIQSEQQELIHALHGWDPTRVPECFFDGESLLQAAKEQPPFDIIFLDIYMPGSSGVNIAKALRDITPNSGIVFVTTSREHAIDAFTLDALHYLVKPIKTEDVVEAFRRLNKLQTRKRPMINLSTGRDSKRVYLDEIYYLQSINHALEITMQGGQIIKVWIALNEIRQQLGDSFLKINRGTIVNMEYIEQMGIDVCIMRDGARLPLTRKEHIAIRNAYDDYLFTQLNKQNDMEVIT